MTKLSPSNIHKTVEEAKESHEKIMQNGTDTLNAIQIKAKKLYYSQTFNGDPHMDIIDVFLSFATYKTPDENRQTPKGTAIDLSSVIAGIAPTFEAQSGFDRSDLLFNDSSHNDIKNIIFYRVLIDPSNSLPDIVDALNKGKDFLEKSLKRTENDIWIEKVTGRPSGLWTKEDVLKFKNEIEIYRLPIMDALFKFDDYDLWLADKKALAAPSPAPEAGLSPGSESAPESAPAPTQEEEEQEEATEEATEGFSLLNASGTWWGWIVGGFLVLFGFVLYMATHTRGGCGCSAVRLVRRSTSSRRPTDRRK